MLPKKPQKNHLSRRVSYIGELGSSFTSDWNNPLKLETPSRNFTM